mgnify:CR=1 FL=1
MIKTSKTTPISGHSNRIIFFGNERLATGTSTDCPLLSSLIEAGYDIAAVVTNNSNTTGRKKRQLEISELAKKHAIPVLMPAQPLDIKEELTQLDATIGVLAAYGRIVPQAMIDIFPLGIINVHPSLLPLHRGSTPIESVILNGGTKTGVSIMALTKQMDAGPVYAQSEIILTGKETKQELADTASEIGARMIVELLPDILNGTVVALPQDESRATYDSLISKSDAIIDWTKPAAQIEREIRAYANWPKSRTQLLGKDVIIHKVSVIAKTKVTPGETEVTKDSLMVDCAQNTLQIDVIQPANKSPMATAAFLNGLTY